ncbi:hypothetical protein [Planctomicrobium sp. SH664]|uniref:hypothetical protein n=1 Tax=Planctomicrobium sp. SH664 TaxID=3448125 RepID=UPI003F5B7FC2
MSDLNSPRPSSPSPSESSIFLVSYPKIVFLWPAWVVSIIGGLIIYFRPENTSLAVSVGWTFLVILMLNLVVLAFDFPRSTSLLLFAVIVSIILGAALIIVYNPNFLPGLHSLLSKIRPVASPSFYLTFASGLGLIYAFVLVISRFDYWEVRPNELLHHHGMLSDLERFSTPNLRIDKEINDVFEFMLARSGRLIIHPSNQPRAIVLDNVLGINQKEEAITKLLGALQVQVRD